MTTTPSRRSLLARPQLDGLLLQAKDWDGPMTTIQYSIRVLPAMDGLKDRLKDAYIEVCEKNPLLGWLNKWAWN